MLRAGRHLGTALLMCVIGLASAQAQMLAPRYAHTATLLQDGRVLIYGGLGVGDGFVIGSEIFDPATGQFLPGPRGHKCRAFHTATLLLDGGVLVAGGFILPYSTSRTAEVFDGRRFVFDRRILCVERRPAPRRPHPQ